MLQATLQRYRAAYAGLPRDVWLLALVFFINRCGTMAVPFMTLYLTSELGLSEGAAGRLVGVYGLGALAGALAGGRLTQRFGPVPVQWMSLACSAPAFAVIPYWRHESALAASLFALGLITESLRPANATAIVQLTTDENRMRGFAVHRLAANLGFSIGPVIGGVLATIDFRWLFYVDAATSLAAAVALGRLFRGRRLDAEPADAGGRASGRPSPLRDGVFVAHLALTLASLMVFFQFCATYPLYLRDHYGLDKPQIGLLFGVNTAAIVAFEMVVLDAIQRWPIVRTMGVGYFLACAGFGMLPFGSTGAYCVIAMLVATVGEMLSFSQSTSFAASRSAPGDESRTMGWYMTVISLAAVAGPAVGTAIYAVDRDAVWYVSLIVGGAVLAGYQLLAPRAARQVCDAPA